MTVSLKEHRRHDRHIAKVNAMIEEKSKKMFGDDSDDSEAEGGEGEYDVDAATEVKSLKSTKKTIEGEKVTLMKDFYTRVSGGLYNSDEKGGTLQN